MDELQETLMRERNEKQTFLRKAVLDAGYDQIKFSTFMDDQADGTNIDNYTLQKLTYLVNQFISQETSALRQSAYQNFQIICNNLQGNDYTQEINMLNLLAKIFTLQDEIQNTILKNLFDTFSYFYESPELNIFFQNIQNLIHMEYWVECQNSNISDLATVCGMDIHQNDLFFARCKHKNDLEVGKCCQRLGCALIGVENKEQRFMKYQVLCLRQKPEFFLMKEGEEFPLNAIPLGFDQEGPLYGARFRNGNSLQLGKCNKKLGGSYPYGDKQLFSKQYEVLVYPDGILFIKGMEWKLDELIQQKIEHFIFAINNYQHEHINLSFSWSMFWDFFKNKFQ